MIFTISCTIEYSIILVEHFGLENGKTLLRPYFKQIELKRYDDYLIVDDAKALMNNFSNFLHMIFTISCTIEYSIILKNTRYFQKTKIQILQIKENMICKHRIKEMIFKRNILSI